MKSERSQNKIIVHQKYNKPIVKTYKKYNTIRKLNFRCLCRQMVNPHPHPSLDCNHLWFDLKSIFINAFCNMTLLCSRLIFIIGLLTFTLWRFCFFIKTSTTLSIALRSSMFGYNLTTSILLIMMSSYPHYIRNFSFVQCYTLTFNLSIHWDSTLKLLLRVYVCVS